MHDTLSDFPQGSVVQVRDFRCMQDDARRLRELGVLEGRELRVLRSGDPLILTVGNSRLGMCASLARQIGIENRQSGIEQQNGIPTAGS